MGQEQLDCLNKEVVKALGAFGGGIAATGGTCGIVVGAVALFSSLYSRGDLEGKEDPRMWTLSKKFIKEFNKLTESYGSSDCRDIARVDWQDREAAKDYYKNPDSRRTICIDLIGESAVILGKILEEKT